MGLTPAQRLAKQQAAQLKAAARAAKTANARAKTEASANRARNAAAKVARKAEVGRNARLKREAKAAQQAAIQARNKAGGFSSTRARTNATNLKRGNTVNTWSTKKAKVTVDPHNQPKPRS